MRSHTHYLWLNTKKRQEIIDIVNDHEALDFGPWQRVFCGEWDGQRRRRVVIKVLGE